MMMVPRMGVTGSGGSTISGKDAAFAIWKLFLASISHGPDIIMSECVDLLQNKCKLPF